LSDAGPFGAWKGVESLKPEELLRILSQAARLKTTMRHCYTEEGRRESVADHSWRIALIAMLMTGIEEYQDFDMNKVIRMCLIHDLGESFTGDIPTFEKDSADKKVEDDLFERWVDAFPEPQRAEWLSLLAEMKALETKEAKLYKALDKIEAIISHNESDISTWLPLEYDLQLTYGKENMQFSKYMTELRAEVDAWTIEKIETETAQ
jgi:putative hydrolase of HD superfamily